MKMLLEFLSVSKSSLIAIETGANALLFALILSQQFIIWSSLYEFRKKFSNCDSVKKNFPLKFIYLSIGYLHGSLRGPDMAWLLRP